MREGRVLGRAATPLRIWSLDIDGAGSSSSGRPRSTGLKKAHVGSWFVFHHSVSGPTTRVKVGGIGCSGLEPRRRATATRS